MRLLVQQCFLQYCSCLRFISLNAIPCIPSHLYGLHRLSYDRGDYSTCADTTTPGLFKGGHAYCSVGTVSWMDTCIACSCRYCCLYGTVISTRDAVLRKLCDVSFVLVRCIYHSPGPLSIGSVLRVRCAQEPDVVATWLLLQFLAAVCVPSTMPSSYKACCRPTPS